MIFLFNEKKKTLYKMFGLIRKILGVTFLVSTVNSLKYILMKNQECKVGEVVVNNEYMTYPYSIKVNRCNGNCSYVSNPYSRLCIPDVIENISVKVFDLISWINKI